MDDPSGANLSLPKGPPGVHPVFTVIHVFKFKAFALHILQAQFKMYTEKWGSNAGQVTCEVLH